MGSEQCGQSVRPLGTCLDGSHSARSAQSGASYSSRSSSSQRARAENVALRRDYSELQAKNTEMVSEMQSEVQLLRMELARVQGASVLERSPLENEVDHPLVVSALSSLRPKEDASALLPFHFLEVPDTGLACTGVNISISKYLNI